MLIDKLSTAVTHGKQLRPSRIVNGIVDLDLNGERDPNENEMYFEPTDYSKFYVFL